MSNNSGTNYFAPVIAVEQTLAGQRKLVITEATGTSGVEAGDGDRKVWVTRDGCAMIKDQLILSDSDLGCLAKRSNWPDRAAADMFRARGSICTYVVDTLADRALVLPDPLGACLCYRFRDQELVAYSSDLRHLRDWLLLRGRKLSVSPYFYALVLAIGNGAYGQSSYEEIEVLPAHVYVSIEQGRTLEISYPFDDFMLNLDISAEETFDSAEQDIRSTVRAIAEHSLSDRICHLTGGFDTRLVLSAILAEGVQDRFFFMCSGPDRTPDKEIARGLAGQFQLTMTNLTGLMTRAQASSRDEQTTWGMIYSAGMRPNCPVDDGHEYNPSTIIVSGGYGECARSFYSQNLIGGITAENIATHQWKSALRDDGRGGQLILSHIAERIANDTSSYLKGRVQSGWKLGQALDLMYAEQRNRYFVGNIATLFSRKTSRIDPLYSLPLLKRALNSDDRDRQENVIGMKLMHRLRPDLLRFKFGNKAFSTQMRTAFDGLDSIVPSTKAPMIDRRLPAQHVRSGEPPISRGDLDRANAIGATPWQVARLSSAQRSCRTLLRSGPNFLGVFNAAVLDRLMGQQLSRRTEIRTVHALHAILRFGLLSHAQPELVSQS